MLSLVKIRVKYILRNPCLLFWTYILIPGIIVFSGIYQIIDKKKKNIETYEKSIINQDSPKVFFDDYDKMYDNLLHYRKLGFLNFAAFIAENTETCDKIKKYLDKHNIHIRDFSGEPKIYEDYQVCTTKESNLSNTTINIIKIEKKEKNIQVLDNQIKLIENDLKQNQYSYSDTEKKAKARKVMELKKQLLLEKKGLEEASTYNETLNNNKNTIESKIEEIRNMKVISQGNIALENVGDTNAADVLQNNVERVMREQQERDQKLAILKNGNNAINADLGFKDEDDYLKNLLG